MEHGSMAVLEGGGGDPLDRAPRVSLKEEHGDPDHCGRGGNEMLSASYRNHQKSLVTWFIKKLIDVCLLEES
jgi:hypothetical protein